jgi:hypothetical protein
MTMQTYEGSYPYIFRTIGRDLLKKGVEVPVPTWHAVDVSNSPAHVSYELQDVSLSFEMPHSVEKAQEVIDPQMPWAEEHFLERVSGRPLNPPPSAQRWLDDGVASRHLKDFGGKEPQYSHTYPERMWPKHAPDRCDVHQGIRFRYGDLGDVAGLLMREPLTRQAFLPIWFPEDTGAHHGERVPCSLGYHFMIREQELSVTYMIRSVDFVRHFCDDVYMAVRLGQWMNEMLVEAGVDTQFGGIAIGKLTMHIMSLHYFEGDRKRMERAYGTTN